MSFFSKLRDFFVGKPAPAPRIAVPDKPGLWERFKALFKPPEIKKPTKAPPRPAAPPPPAAPMVMKTADDFWDVDEEEYEPEDFEYLEYEGGADYGKE